MRGSGIHVENIVTGIHIPEYKVRQRISRFLEFLLCLIVEQHIPFRAFINLHVGNDYQRLRHFFRGNVILDGNCEDLPHGTGQVCAAAPYPGTFPFQVDKFLFQRFTFDCKELRFTGKRQEQVVISPRIPLREVYGKAQR